MQACVNQLRRVSITPSSQGIPPREEPTSPQRVCVRALVYCRCIYITGVTGALAEKVVNSELGPPKVFFSPSLQKAQALRMSRVARVSALIERRSVPTVETLDFAHVLYPSSALSRLAAPSFLFVVKKKTFL